MDFTSFAQAVENAIFNASKLLSINVQSSGEMSLTVPTLQFCILGLIITLTCINLFLPGLLKYTQDLGGGVFYPPRAPNSQVFYPKSIKFGM